MNTLQSLSQINISPEKNISIIDIDGGLEDDSTVVLADSMNKIQGTTPSSKEGTKIIHNDSKLPIKKKTLSQVSKIKLSRVTPKAKRSGFEFLREKKEPKRIHSVKNSKSKNEGQKANTKDGQFYQDHLIENKTRISHEKPKENSKETKQPCTKSFKSLNGKILELQLSPKNQKISPKNPSNSFGKQELNELYMNNTSKRIQQVDFPLKVKKNLEIDPFVYITSSSEENSP